MVSPCLSPSKSDLSLSSVSHYNPTLLERLSVKAPHFFHSVTLTMIRFTAEIHQKSFIMLLRIQTNQFTHYTIHPFKTSPSNYHNSSVHVSELSILISIPTSYHCFILIGKI